jgi:aspartate/methionine/tyrosine aminotransferase
MDKLNKSLIPEIIDNQLSNYVKSILINNTRFDKKFCYYLLAIEWVCSVPLSWFNSTYEWFRITLLENDIDKFKLILNKIKNTILLFK